MFWQCRKFAACERECTEGGEAHVSEPQVTLNSLQPLAQYIVTVSAVDGLEGLNKSIVFATHQSSKSSIDSSQHNTDLDFLFMV